MKPGGGSSPDHNENPFFCEGNGAEKKDCNEERDRNSR